MKTKMKKYQDGGPADAMLKAMGQKPTSTKKTMKYVRKKGSGYIPPAGKKMQSGGTSGGYPSDTTTSKSPEIYGNTTPGKIFRPAAETTTPGEKFKPGMKTGGMVNPNANLKAGKVAGSKGVKSGVNPKAAASKVAKGRSGGTSVAPKTAIPKAQMGGMAGGRPISERAAARKVKKGKGTITKSYPSGPEEKGSYVGFSKEARKSNSPFKSMKDSKPARPIRKKGGAMKKGY